MTGEEVKSILIDQGYHFKDIADKMEISSQLLHKFLSVNDIKTGTLQRIAEAINQNIDFFLNKSLREGDNLIEEKKDLSISSSEKEKYLAEIIELQRKVMENLEKELKNLKERLKNIGEITVS